MSAARFPHRCPSCGAPLVIVKLQCSACDTVISGRFTSCEVCKLEGEWRELFDLFMKTRGNLKAMERQLRLSYPTVRQKVDELFTKLGQAAEQPKRPSDILKQLREGSISVEEAERLLRRKDQPAEE